MEIPQIVLNDGLALPAIGFGTYKLKGAEGVTALTSALDVGYRLLDTAYNYENEGTVGEAIRQSSVPRSEIFITSKLPGRYQEAENVLMTIEESLYRLGLDYLDLYLIHWPNPKQDHYVEAWQEMLKAKEKGLIRSVGVCNFLPEHLLRLEKETGVLPSVNQIELHPFFNQETQRQFDKEQGIVTEAWSPLGRASAVLENETIIQIAEAHKKSVPQIILRWETQLGVIPIPKSSTPSRQEDNLYLFDFQLSEEEMQTINHLTKADGRLKNQDPAFYEEF